jgi:hypothetical protein
MLCPVDLHRFRTKPHFKYSGRLRCFKARAVPERARTTASALSESARLQMMSPIDSLSVRPLAISICAARPRSRAGGPALPARLPSRASPLASWGAASHRQALDGMRSAGLPTVLAARWLHDAVFLTPSARLHSVSAPALPTATLAHRAPVAAMPPPSEKNLSEARTAICLPSEPRIPLRGHRTRSCSMRASGPTARWFRDGSRRAGAAPCMLPRPRRPWARTGAPPWRWPPGRRGPLRSCPPLRLSLQQTPPSL